MLLNERFFAPTNRQKSKGSEKLCLTSGLNYPYLIRERGSFAFTAAAWGSNNAVEESSRCTGSWSHTSKKKKIASRVFIHKNLMLLVSPWWLQDSALLRSQRGDVEWQKGEAQSWETKKTLFHLLKPSFSPGSLPRSVLFSNSLSQFKASKNAQQRTHKHSCTQSFKHAKNIFPQSGTWISNDPWLSARVCASNGVFTVVPHFL